MWLKSRSTTYSHRIHDAIRGNASSLASQNTDAEDTVAGRYTLESDGFTVINDGAIYNGSGVNYVAWNWDMGGTTSTNHTQSNLTSVYRANTTYGQSVVTYTGDGAAGQGFAHGLGASPHFWIIKNRTDASDWYVYHQSLGNTKALNLNSNAAAATSAAWANYGPVSNAITVNAAGGTNTSGKNYVAYVFEEKTAYSKFGSYIGNGGSNAITTGFEPALVIIKRSSGGTGGWMMYDNVRGVSKQLQSNSSAAEDTVAGKISFQSTGFTCLIDHSETNSNGDNYIYAAFADNREYAYWLDQSGNNNDWTSNNLTESDISVDSPTNNFCTWNPLDKSSSQTLSEGNLVSDSTVNDAWKGVRGTFGISSGKWYWEYLKTNTYLHSTVGIAIADAELDVSTALSGITDWWMYSSYNGAKIGNGSETSYGATYQDVGDVVCIALDMDNGTLTFYKNGVSQGQAFNSGLSGKTVYPYRLAYNSADLTVANFGQDSSFAGNKTAQGNQDGNDIGDFYYTPPTGYLALCTKNLPDVAVTPSEHFNTVLYTGNGGTNVITGVGFQSDWTWIKQRSNADSNVVFDAVRGVHKRLVTDATAAEADWTSVDKGLDVFSSDGFTVKDDSSGNYSVNKNSGTFVAWNWKANGSGSSNTNGSITSTVSANVDAGFSIVSYTGTGANATVGHGLSKTPELFIVKNRDHSSKNWAVYYGEATRWLKLNGNDASAPDAIWNNTAPTSSVFSLNSSVTANNSGDNLIAYCFHSVDGYSKVGSFEGNSNADGTFVYTGFRPAFVLMKCADSSTHWYMYDSARNPSNVVGEYISADDSGGGSDDVNLDFVSNGFKMRTNFGGLNSNTMIYICFSETPFKYSNAR